MRKNISTTSTLKLPDANESAPGSTTESAPFKLQEAAFSNLSPADQALFQRFGSGPRTSVPDVGIHRAFEAHAQAAPNAVAAQHLGESITYGELDRQADRLADLLVRHGVRRGDHVAVFLQRSIPMLVAILATLKAGAAYVPQCAGIAPPAQLRHVVKIAATPVILTTSACRHLVPIPDDVACILVDEFMETAAAAPEPPQAARPRVPCTGADACFILFTSGTTGLPNGVRVTHGNVCNILLTAPGDLGMRPGLKVSQLLNIGFDMAAWEILGCLAHGATLVIRGADFQAVAERVDILIATPSILATLDEEACRQVRVVAVAGEPCPRPLADRWARSCTFYNACGPTEVTIVNTMQRHDPSGPLLTIGKPTPNNTVYVLDAEMRPCAMGEVGEMWAGGDCVSAGYLANDALNAERYRPDPFLGGDRRMFRTRDLARWTQDGELEHFGRVDDQVKIRGFRVELDSVSAILEQTPGCTRATTLKLDDRHLVSFVCPAGVDVADALARVAAAMPYYCTPTLIVAVDGLPVTGRGKIDKHALLQIAADRLAQSRRSPRVPRAAIETYAAAADIGAVELQR